MENERLSKENKDVTDKSQEAVRASEVASANGQLDELMKEGFTDKQKEFIKMDFKAESVKDLSDDGLKQYIENGKKRFAENAKLFGVEETPVDKTKPGSSSGTPEEDDMERLSLEAIGAIDPEKSK